MIALSHAAERQLDALIDYYTKRGRDAAISRLLEDVEVACSGFENGRSRLYAAPRPYPALADLGFDWTKSDAYWVAFDRTIAGAFIAAVFHESADMPAR